MRVWIMPLWLRASRACRVVAAQEGGSPKPWCRLPAMETGTVSYVRNETTTV